MSKKTFSKKKSAFSLIELSIVLIILGLLIAGVTGGASLIKNAQLRSVAVEGNLLRSAVATFVAKYEGYPGDFNGNLGLGTSAAPLASFSTGNIVKPQTATGGTAGTLYVPDQDGAIEAENCEGLVALIDLANVGATTYIPFQPGGTTAFVGTAASCNTAGALLPPSSNGSNNGSLSPSKVKNAGWALDGSPAGVSNYWNGTAAITFPGQNYAVLTSSVTPAAVMSSTSSLIKNATAAPLARAVLSPADAASVDSKVDDGRALTGSFIAIPSVASCLTTGAYTTTAATTNTVACAIAYSVDLL